MRGSSVFTAWQSSICTRAKHSLAPHKTFPTGCAETESQEIWKICHLAFKVDKSDRGNFKSDFGKTLSKSRGK